MNMIINLILLLFAIISLPGCKSLYQDADHAMYRAPGARLLEESPDVGIPARLHWQYAWLSLASYNAIVDQSGEETAQKNRRAGPISININDQIFSCDSPENELFKSGWEQFHPPWPPLESPLYQILKNSHTRVQVWENKKQRKIVVAFGGTEPTNILDWLSNLRWFIPEREDEYSIVAKQVAPQFMEEIKRRATLPEYSYLRDMKIHATGHSLGGGLAQQFAYALPPDPEGIVPRVTRVYAFDPSPVTGHNSVDPAVRKHNSCGMKIDRIYERGEILAAARALTGFFLIPSKNDPAIRGVRYMLFWNSPFKSISSHSMPRLACYLQHAKGRPLPPDAQDEIY